jgi:hypothetical protein
MLGVVHYVQNTAVGAGFFHLWAAGRFTPARGLVAKRRRGTFDAFTYLANCFLAFNKRDSTRALNDEAMVI